MKKNYALSEKSVNFADDLCVETAASGGPLEDDFFCNSNINTTEFQVALVDAMAEEQSLIKLPNMSTCGQLSDQVVDRLLDRYGSHNEVHVIFDRYDFCHFVPHPRHHKYCKDIS